MFACANVFVNPQLLKQLAVYKIKEGYFARNNFSHSSKEDAKSINDISKNELVNLLWQKLKNGQNLKT